MTWNGTDASGHAFQTVAQSSAVILLFQSFVEDFTLVRTRGLLSVASDQTAATEFQIGAVGIAIVSTAAFTAGAASVPTPVTEAAWDGWLWYQSFANRMVFVSGVGLETPYAVQFEIDSKAMRKVSADETLIVVAENASGAHGLSIAAPIRTLLKFA